MSLRIQSKVPDYVSLRNQVFIITHQGAGFTPGKVLGFLETETTHDPKRPHRLTLPFCAVPLASVFNDRNVVFLADSQYFIQVRRSSVHMRGHNGTRMFGDAVLDVIGVDLESLQVGIGKYRQRVTQHNGVDGGDVSIGGDNNLISRAHSYQLQGQLKGVGSAGGHNTAPGPHSSHPFLLKLGNELCIRCAPFVIAERLEDELLIALVGLGPIGKWGRANRRASVYGQYIGIARRLRASRNGTCCCQPGRRFAQEISAGRAGLYRLRKNSVALGASTVSTTPALGAPPLLI
jgi:hypothetical protein